MQFDISNVNIDKEHFLSAISIYLYKPHVINKRVTTVRFALALDHTDRKYSTGKNIVDKRTLISKNPRIYHDQDEYILSDEYSIEFRPIIFNSINQKSCGIQISAYRFEFLSNENKIRLIIFDNKLEKEILWLKNILLTKIVKWSQTNINNSTENTTLKLISIEEYQHEYERLKIKYGKYLTTNWCENTDPQKHVFEDLGIASYLLTYCRQYSSSFKKPIKFIDLGCGNGLLTFLLSSEGYSGLGIDMRRRRSWSLFDSSLYLESLIDPHSSILHNLIISNEYTFLIGNHSDELTPWLPVLARQCSCDVFLLPCCFFDFSGKKFITNNHDDTTQYEQYLLYIENISKILEFDIKKDKLRIPSTKNICFMLHQKDFNSNNSIRTRLFDHFGIDINLEHADPQIPNHRSLLLKSKPEFYSTKFSIIKFLFEYILTHNNSLTISSAYDILPNELCEQLKSENGGLKSIILSYRHALYFDSKTKLITLSNPELNSIKLKQSSKLIFKTKPCFFYIFHPNGCPLTDDQCAFSHCKK
jgi:tRNASer (uridine44-2'-O)-methyltransferase